MSRHVSGSSTGELGGNESSASVAESSESDDSTSSTNESGRCCCCSRASDSREAGTSTTCMGFLVDVLNGISQVCFFTNSCAGVVFVVAILIGTPRTAVILGLVGVFSGTSFSWCFGLDVEARKDGTLGYNATLVGCAFAFAIPDFWWAVLATVGAAGMSAFVAAGLLKVIKPQLTLAFNFVALSTLAFIDLKGNHGGTRVSGFTWNSVLPQMNGVECLAAILNGVSQIYFVSSPISGFIILLGIGLASPFMTFSTLLGSLVATLLAAGCGADLPRIQKGIWGYNAALTALWISFHFKQMGYIPVLLLVCCGAAAATAAFAGMDVVVERTHGVAPSCFTLPFNSVGLSLAALQSLIKGIYAVAQTKQPSPECGEQC
mmetsp:Transcript_21012/g.46218  ORF Transcript_21012/g.46218 Transcript_21012/m.46218 type:complete len:376 (-) Transcript_21012:12-1139(-)